MGKTSSPHVSVRPRVCCARTRPGFAEFGIIGIEDFDIPASFPHFSHILDIELRPTFHPHAFAARVRDQDLQNSGLSESKILILLLLFGTFRTSLTSKETFRDSIGIGSRLDRIGSKLGSGLTSTGTFRDYFSHILDIGREKLRNVSVSVTESSQLELKILIFLHLFGTFRTSLTSEVEGPPRQSYD